MNQTFSPILSEHYAGTEIDHIDQLQSNWRRSLTFAIGDQFGDRLYDLLLCIREGMINALVHGCERSAEKFSQLQINLNETKDRVRIIIDDPGRGHQFDIENPLADTFGKMGTHMGLRIIYHLSDYFAIENRGTSLVFEFAVTPESPFDKDAPRS